jgi:hypothetical protein
MHATIPVLLLALLAGPAAAQSADIPSPDVAAARAKTCAAFLSEVSTHTAAGGTKGTTPSFALVWGDLLRHDPSLGKIALGSRMFESTLIACQRVRGRSLGATMDAEFARL